MRALVLGHRREDHVQQGLKSLGQDAIEVVLPLAARIDQARHAQSRQVVADRGLALLQQIAQRADVQFAVSSQIQKHAKRVSSERSLKILTRSLTAPSGTWRRGLGRRWRFGQMADHVFLLDRFRCGEVW